jgi:hypothetical protein
MDRWQSQLTGWGTQSNGHVRWCNGLLVDLRDMPREVQKIAFGKSMILYVLLIRIKIKLLLPI